MLISEPPVAAEPELAEPSAAFETPEAGVAAALRESLRPLLATMAGDPPRPVRLMRRIGLDKSLASRLVQAAKAESDSQFLHVLPSPTGLRILIERSRSAPEAAAGLPAFERAVDAFAALLDALPGGRQALDARLGEEQSSIRERREHIARQASFKAVSFLFGHYCETLSTAIFLFPSADGRHVDAIEVHRRLGLCRLTPSTPVPLLVLMHQSPSHPTQKSQMLTIEGDTSAQVDRYFISEGCNLPLPALEMEHDGDCTRTFLIGSQSPDPLPARLTTAMRMTRVELVRPDTSFLPVRTYMLYTPCQRVVREIYLADGLWPGAVPHVGFFLPSPTEVPLTSPPDVPNYRRLQLTASIEPLPGHTGQPAGLTGVADHGQVLAAVLRRAGLEGMSFRGWRCQTPYPVPLVEMQMGFRLGGAAGQA